jgi:hypothetical protein
VLIQRGVPISDRVLSIFPVRGRLDGGRSYKTPTLPEEQHPVEIQEILLPNMLYALRLRFSDVP